MKKKILTPLLVTIVLVEAVLWIGFRQGMSPAIDIQMNQDIPGLSKEVHFQKNDLGLRTHTIHQRKKEEGTYRVIILGASTAEQATHSNEDTWGLLLEENLKKELPGKKIEVGIYAVGGMKTHELFRWTKRHLIELQPDLVITLLGINNLSTDMMYLNNGQEESLMNYVDKKQGVLGKLAAYSQIARYAKNIKKNAIRLKYTKENNGINFDIAGLQYFRAQYHQTPFSDPPEKFPTRLLQSQTRWLFGFLNKHDIPSLTLTQPSLFKPELDFIQEGETLSFKDKSLPREKQEELITELTSLWFILNDGTEYLRYQPSDMRRCLDEYNTLQIKLATEYQRYSFPLHEQLEPTAENFFDDCHFTDLGSERIAELITPSVVKIITKK